MSDNDNFVSGTVTLGGLILGIGIGFILMLIISILVSAPYFRAQGRCFPNEVVGNTSDLAICSTPEGLQVLKTMRYK